jgi:hypothetical protein
VNQTHIVRDDDALQLQSDMVITIRLNNTDKYLTFSDNSINGVDIDHFEFITTTEAQASSNPDCLFIIKDWSTDGCHLMLASLGHYVTFPKDNHIRRKFIATLSDDMNINTCFNIIPTIQTDYSTVRITSNTEYHLVALDMNDSSVLGSRSVLPSAKGLFKIKRVQNTLL